MSEKQINIAILGAGMISSIYLSNLTGFRVIKVKAIADIILEKAKKVAQDFNIEKSCPVEEVLEDPL
jgi:predicted dehydrogenase